MDLIHPHSIRDVQEALRACAADHRRVLVTGGRTHMDKGNASELDAELWTTLLDDVVAYDPAEMLVVVEGGVRIHDLRALLAEGGQEWPVDAPDNATVGGVIATGLDPVRRLRAGALRDTVVELTAVTGDGRLVTSGARTVKNVTGYDVHRLMTGSLGTLGVIVRVALKLRPLPKAARTLVTQDGGLAVGARVLGSVPLPAAVLAEPARVIVRLEGWPEEVEEQTNAARAVAEVFVLEDRPFPDAVFPESPILAEAAVAPSKLPELLGLCHRWRASLGVGTAWVACETEDELERLRARAGECGGIAPVVRGPGGLGEAAVPAPDVHRRLKAAFDPAGILAPGRFWAGI